MKIKCLVLLLSYCSLATAQKVVPLYGGSAPGSEKWSWSEAEMYSDLWQTRVVYNVAQPTLTAYLPPAPSAHGTSVVICPGGGFHALSIDTEGVDVAKWLNKRGIAAFVLKYRLVRSETDDPVKELNIKMAQGGSESLQIIPFAIADGLEAVRYIRENASDFHINPERIGIIGFSAGGTIAAAVGLRGKGDSRPDFVAPVYAYLPEFLMEETVPDDAPPMFVTAATDDQLGLASHSVLLYEKWMKAGKSAEMHLYAEGGHGFGMRTRNVPSDTWIERYGEWIEASGLLLSSDQSRSQNMARVRENFRYRRDREEELRNDWANLSRFKTDNENLGAPKPGEKRVVFMGNSITIGWLRAHPEFFADRPYINRGISGQTTPQMLVRFRQDVIDLQPAAVVILAGINDIAENTGPTTHEAILGNISSMALLAKAHGIEVILSSVLPAYDFRWRPGLQPAEKVVELNKMIRAFAKENNIYYLDYFNAVVDSRNGMKKEYAYDEVHPTPEGYKLMEPLVERAIQTVLNKK